MGPNGTLKRYNEIIRNWDFKKERLKEYLQLLTERNLFIYEQTSLIDFYPDCEIPSENESIIIHNDIETLEHIAFHVGIPHQRRLYSLVEEDTNNPNNEGVFFTLKPEDVVYFSDFDDDPMLMVYFLDLTSTKGSRIQTNYKSSVISRHDLDDLIKPYPLNNRDLLRIKHRQLNEKWITENTIPFEVSKINDFKQKDYDWLIIPCPINVKY